MQILWRHSTSCDQIRQVSKVTNISICEYAKMLASVCMYSRSLTLKVLVGGKILILQWISLLQVINFRYRWNVYRSGSPETQEVGVETITAITCGEKQNRTPLRPYNFITLLGTSRFDHIHKDSTESSASLLVLLHWHGYFEVGIIQPLLGPAQPKVVLQ